MAQAAEAAAHGEDAAVEHEEDGDEDDEGGEGAKQKRKDNVRGQLRVL